MRKRLLPISFVFVVFVLLSGLLSVNKAKGKSLGTSGNSAGSTIAALSEKRKPLSFIENKGQVTDQNHNTRTDIQFRMRATNGLNIFIGNGAIHYQFCKS